MDRPPNAGVRITAHTVDLEQPTGKVLAQIEALALQIAESRHALMGSGVAATR